MSEKYTRDYEKIREWITRHKGKPAVLKKVREEGDAGEESPDMLHVSFDAEQPDLEEISWDEFFERFENEHLAFVYDDQATKREGYPIFDFIDRDRAHDSYDAADEWPDSGDVDELESNLYSDDR